MKLIKNQKKARYSNWIQEGKELIKIKNNYHRSINLNIVVNQTV